VEHAQVAELKRFARQLEETGRSEETRAAARAILLLADEVESLTSTLAAERGADEERVAVSAEGDDGDGNVVSWFRRTFSTATLGENGDGSE
jgi:hypothetical protein